MLAVQATPPDVLVPRVVGLTVREATTRLRQAGFRTADGTVYLPRRTPGGALRFVRAPRAGERVTSQSPAAGSAAGPGDAVEVATARGGGDLVAGLPPDAGWDRIAYAGGTLTLRATACGAIDHVTIARPRGTGVPRRITVWRLERVDGTCDLRRHRSVVVRPDASWTRQSLGTPFTTTSVPDPTLHPTGRATLNTAIVQPDRRHVVVGFFSGACDHLQAASATVSGRVVTVSLVLGTRETGPVVCPAIALFDSTVVTTPVPIPRGARVRGA